MDDISRPVATERDTPPNITINEAIEMYSRAGHPRTPRSIQRYCATGHLDCIKEQTSLGDKYFINPTSVERHIAQISELVSLEDRTPGRDMTRHVAPAVAAQAMNEIVRQEATPSPVVPTHVASEIIPNAQSSEQIVGDAPRHAATTGRDRSRHDAAETQDTSSYVAQLEREVERADEDQTFLRGHQGG